MNNDTKTLDNILYHSLRPWLDQNTLDEKFASKLSEVKIASPAFKFQYEIDFQRPFNHKTKYYSKLIINETIKNCNQLHELISRDNNPKLIKYWLNDSLDKKLKTRLTDIGKLIKAKNYFLEFINPRKITLEIDQDHKSNTYIVHLLKFAYMHIYLELQEAFKDWIDDRLIEEDFYTQLLYDPIPKTPNLKEIIVIEVESKLTIPKKIQSTPQQISLTSFSYKQLATNPDKLTDLHDSLKLHNFIAQSTTLANFKRVFSNKKIVTPIVWTGNLSELYFFIKLIYKEHKLVEDLKQKQWEITCICFVKQDGQPFERSKFRTQKRPNTTGDKLDEIVKLMK